MPRVAMIVWNEFRNDARVLKEAETLQAAGYQVTVYALHTPGVTQEQETLDSGVKVVRVSRSPFWKWRKNKNMLSTEPRLPRLARNDEAHLNTSSPNTPIAQPIEQMSLKRRVLRVMARFGTHARLLLAITRSKPDIVHAHDVNTLVTAYAAAVLARAPLVYDAHEISTSREGYASFRAFVFKIEKYLMPRCAATITTTTTRAKFFARAYGIRRPLVLQNRPRFMVIKRTSRIRDTLALTENWPIVLYQGGLQQGRGLERLIEAAAHVEHAYFVLIGGGRLEAALKDKVQKLGLQNKVYFIPTLPLTSLPHYTASADVGVQVLENTCFNHYSTDSNKLFEYIIAGLPIIASSFPEISNIVRSYDVGMLIEPGNLSELIHALRTIISSSKLRQHYHLQALAAARNLNWGAQEKDLLALYNKILPSSNKT